VPVSRVQIHHRAGLVDIALSGGAYVRRIVRMSRFDLVIFDCDGVLVDSERLVVRTEAEILSGLGWPGIFHPMAPETTMALLSCRSSQGLTLRKHSVCP